LPGSQTAYLISLALMFLIAVAVRDATSCGLHKKS
jgi:hypothetical protein